MVFRIQSERNFNAANFNSLPRARNWFFTMNILSQHHLYVNNTCTKFHSQKIHQKKDIQNLSTCVRSYGKKFTTANFNNLIRIEISLF